MPLLRQNITKPLFSFEHRAKLSRIRQAAQARKQQAAARSARSNKKAWKKRKHENEQAADAAEAGGSWGQRVNVVNSTSIEANEYIVHVVNGLPRRHWSDGRLRTQRFEDVVVLLHVPSPWSWSGPSVPCYGFSHNYDRDRDRSVEQAFYKHRPVKNLKSNHSLKVRNIQYVWAILLEKTC